MHARRYAEAAASEGAREVVLYPRADAFAMLTPEDLAATPPAWTGPSVPRLVVGFRDEEDFVALGDARGGAHVFLV